MMEIQTPDFRLLFESSPGLYLVLTPKLEIVAVSEAYLKATMVKRDEILGRGLFEVFPDNPNDPSATGTRQLRASLDRVLRNKTSDVMAIQKYDIRRPDGTFEERHWSPTNFPVFGADKQIHYLLHQVEDVTEFVSLKKERIEQNKITEVLRYEKDQLEKVRQSQRMEAMGQLAGGVAHDFNNILATLMILTEQMTMDSELPAQYLPNLNLIYKNCETAASLTRQLLAFSRKQVLQPKVLNLNPIVKDMRDMLRRILNENITLNINLSSDLKNTLIDPGQVEQVLLNLTVNARDAMPRGGQITIETSNVTLDESMISGNMSVPAGNYALLSVKDTGVGMDAATQARLFEPFFTTKGVGKGTGLGLATIYGIVKQNNGTIWVYSEPNRGSIFKIYLPLVNETVAEESKNRIEPKSLMADSDKNRVLVIEDQQHLRNAVVEILQKNGYVVHQAENGLRALEVLERNKSIDLVITDVVMPEMGGMAFSAKLDSLGYKMKLLYMSGYTEDVLVSHGVSEDHPYFLEKPFSLKALLLKVKTILSET